MIRGKQEELIATDIPKMVKFPAHREPSSVYLNSSIFPEVKITIVPDEVSKLVNSGAAELHTHNIPEVYPAISENMVFEITLGKDTYVVE